MDRSWSFVTLVLIGFTVTSSNSNLNRTSPIESLYDVQLDISSTSQCTLQDYSELCSAITILDYKQCELLTTECNRKAKLRVSFSTYRIKHTIVEELVNIQSYKGLTIVRSDAADVNECTGNIHICSKNGYCTNTLGTYGCQCGIGYQESRTSTQLPGTYCVSRCNSRSCRNGGVCSAAGDEDSEVSCQCLSGYTGDACQSMSGVSALPQWTIVLIAVIAGIAALTGVGLCVYACYRIFSRRSLDDDESDTSSMAGFKPRAIPGGEYDRMTDLGSISRSNRGFASTIDEESERGTIKSDRLRFGGGQMSSRMSNQSEHGDPTPPINPFHRTDRHAAEDIVSQPDYY